MAAMGKTSAALRECTSMLVDNPVLASPARASGNWDGAARVVYAHQLESGWLPPRLTVTNGQLGAELLWLRARLEKYSPKPEQTPEVDV